MIPQEPLSENEPEKNPSVATRKNTAAVAEKGDFPDTSKSFYEKIHSKDREEINRALERFCENYWLPLYVFLRRTGEDHHDASDLVQDFVAGELAEHRVLVDWEPSRGSLHAFLKTCLDRFRKKFHRGRVALKRGGDSAKTHISINTDGACQYFENRLLQKDDTPDITFDREWAYAVMNDAHNRLRRQYAQSGQLEEFELLLENLELRANREPGELTYEKIANQLGLSVNTVKKRMKRLRVGFHQTLRETVADTVDANEVENEVSYILSLLS